MVARVTVYEETIAAGFRPGGMVYNETNRIGKYNKRVAESLCPVRTGWLLNSLEYYVLPRGKYSHFYTISVDTPYAHYVLEGTIGIPIVPKNNQYMWMRPMPYSHMPFNTQKGTGGRWPFKTVKGQKANDFLGESLQITLYDQGII
jgi:hypothetical protein